MLKFKCPYCENKTFSLWQKFIAGGMASKGVECPKCGKHAVHGLKSTILRTVLLVAAFVYIMTHYNSESINGVWVCAAVLAGAYILCMICNGLFFQLEKNNRKDIR